MTSISKKFLEEFIEIFRTQPAVWDTKNDSYRNKVEKDKSWKLLLKKYKEIEVDATVETVKKKVHGLRASYRRELAKLKKSERSGASTDDVYVPALWYFDALDFLRDQDTQSASVTAQDDPTDFEQSPKETKKRKHDETGDFLKRAVEHLEQRRNRKGDNAAVFGEGWGMIFRNLDPEQQIFCKRIIDETLAHAQLGQLSYTSRVSLHRQSNVNSNPSSPQQTYTLQNSQSPTHSVDIKHFSPISFHEGRLTVEEVNRPSSSFQQLFNTMAKLDEKIGFIGGGNMAFSIGSGLVNRGIVKAGQVFCSGPNLENLQRWREMGVATTEENNEVLDKSDIIFLCVKPHILTPCALQLANNHVYTDKDKDKLFVSVLAGVNLRDLEQSFSFIERLKMIRTMPNTPIQVGEGCTVYTPGSYVVQQDLEKVHLMLNSLGIAQQVPESMIDAVTGVSGCGPAFVYTVIEALADGAVKNGVPRQMALQFATQTLLGAAKMVMITGKHPAVLRDEVCSPGGATIVGVHELEKGNLRSTLINAVEKSSQRSAELGRKGD